MADVPKVMTSFSNTNSVRPRHVKASEKDKEFSPLGDIPKDSDGFVVSFEGNDKASIQDFFDKW